MAMRNLYGISTLTMPISNSNNNNSNNNKSKNTNANDNYSNDGKHKNNKIKSYRTKFSNYRKNRNSARNKIIENNTNNNNNNNRNNNNGSDTFMVRTANTHSGANINFGRHSTIAPMTPAYDVIATATAILAFATATAFITEPALSGPASLTPTPAITGTALAVAANLSVSVLSTGGITLDAIPLTHDTDAVAVAVAASVGNSTATTTQTTGVRSGSASGINASSDISFNESNISLAGPANNAAPEYIFDRTDVRIIFITLYTLVFCCCFFGNLLVILVVTMSRRLRSITNFFLANLALADFCVGLFCVMQNLSIYLIDSWVFGDFLCRMYQFVHSLSYTASIFILVVICTERYFAIVHPITCKQILTATRLRIVILTVWVTAAVYSTPKFIFSKTIKNIHTADGQEEEICVLDRKMFNSKVLDMINFVLLYAIPLLVMTVLYSKIAIALWRSSRGFSHQAAQQQENSMDMHNSMYHHQNHHHHHHHHHSQHSQHGQHGQHGQHSNHQLHHNHQQHPSPVTPISGNSSVGGSIAGISAAGPASIGGLLSRKQSSKYEKHRGVSITESQHDNYQVSLDADRTVVTTYRKTSIYHHSHPQQQPHQRHGTQRVTHNMSHSSSNVLRARRGVVRMLIVFVLTFALCNLPYHARKMWQYWSRSYRGGSNFNALLTPLTFLVMYVNSGLNPLLYAFLSRNFRKGMKELLLCSWKKGKGKSSSNSSVHHKRMAKQVSEATQSLPTDTTHIGNDQL